MQSFNILANTEELKYDLIRRVAFLEDNLVIFYHVSVSKIWPGKGSDFSQRETIQ